MIERNLLINAYKKQLGMVAFVLSAALLVALPAHAAVGDEPDDLLPGTPFTTNPTTGSLNGDTDPNDVFSTTLAANTTINMTLVAPEKSAKGTKNVRFGLRLFGPTATALNATPLVSEIGNRVNCAQYTPDSAGTYYLNAHASTGNGNYSLYLGQATDAETSPGTRIGFGKYKTSSLAPTKNQFTKWYNVPISRTKTTSVHMRNLVFPGAVAGDQHSVAIDVYKPNGAFLTDGVLQTAGAITFRPRKIGLHFVKLTSCEPISPQFSFAVTKKIATKTTLKKKVSSKRRKGRYRATLTARVKPSQRKARFRFTIRKCKSSGKSCKKVRVVTKRAKKRGTVKVVSKLRSGRYEATAKFLGSSKRLSSQGKPVCLAVGPTGTCI